MKFFILLILIMFTLSCSKNTKQVQDEGPQFKVGSGDFKISGVGTTAVTLKREDLENGPLIELYIDHPQQVAKSDRSIICGDFEIKAPTLFNRDPKISAFKISDKEFPGLHSLPTHATCKLSIKLENQNGSTVKKETPLQFLFDQPQKIEVTKYSAQRGYIGQSMRLVPLDVEYLKNPFQYAVGVKYKAETNCYGYTAVTPTDPNHKYQLTTGEPYGFYSNKIEVIGNFNKLEGDFSTFVSFVIPPGQSVQINTYSTMLSSVPNKITIPSPMANIETTLYGACIDHCVDHYANPGLYLWNDIEKTYKDNTEPVKFNFAPGSIGALPGMKPVASCRNF